MAEARRERRGRRRKSPARILLLFFVLLLALGGGLFFVSYNGVQKAADPGDTTAVTVDIPAGTSVKGIAVILKGEGLIKNEFFFRLYVKRTGKRGEFKQGTFSLNKAMTADEIIATLTGAGGSTGIRFTIPEGYNTLQIKNRLVEQGLVTEDGFMEEIRSGKFDYDFLADCPAGDGRLEGFLYPDTYEVFEGESAHSIIDRMLKNFDNKFKPEYYDRAKAQGISVRDAVTMGSIVERESKSAEERPLMAGVFYNRLDSGMKLESCATIQYILGEPKEFLTYDDLAIESPYNSYLHKGLPPGPICNPRIESIEAALYPDENDYLFFVLSPKLDGTHNFSKDYDTFLGYKAEYEKAVKNR